MRKPIKRASLRFNISNSAIWLRPYGCLSVPPPVYPKVRRSVIPRIEDWDGDLGKQWRFFAPYHTSSPHAVGQDDDQSQGLCQERKDSLVLLAGMSPCQISQLLPRRFSHVLRGGLDFARGLDSMADLVA
jgi:hypothetical protein